MTNGEMLANMGNGRTADDLVKVALLAMLHDKTGLTGTVEEVNWADSQRFAHLEDCPDAAVVGPVDCAQDCTSTGTGMEIITTQFGCPHGDPIAVKKGGYGIGHLLNETVRIGQQIEDEREWGDDDD